MQRGDCPTTAYLLHLLEVLIINKIIVSILLFAIAVSLVISVIIPCSEQIKSTGDKTFGIVKNLNDNMR